MVGKIALPDARARAPHVSRDYLFAYQPVLDRQLAVVGHELLYRRERANEALVSDPTEATATVIANAFVQFEATQFLKGRKAFVNVGEDFLLSDLITLLPRDQVVIELLETISLSRQIVERCHRLKAMGYVLALDDLVSVDYCEPILDAVALVKVDVRQVSPERLAGTVRQLRRWPVSLLAEKVETAEDFRRCQALGFDYFQGYHFGRPVPVAGRRLTVPREAVLALLGAIWRGADDSCLEGIVRRNVGLALHLLRLVNSLLFPSRGKVQSVRHALAIIGHRQLARWLQLLLFVAGERDGLPAALAEGALRRGCFLALLHGGRASRRDLAYLTGILSPMDALLGEPMERLVARLNLADEVGWALVAREGALGRLLLLCSALEEGDFRTVHGLLAELSLAISPVMAAWDRALHLARQGGGAPAPSVGKPA